MSACESEQARLDRDARSALKETLYDPTSFLLRKLHFGEDNTGARAVCGEVNGKNRMGGFVGFQPFVADGFKPGETPKATIQPISTEYSASAGASEAYLTKYHQFCETASDKAERLHSELVEERFRRTAIKRNEITLTRDEAEASAKATLEAKAKRDTVALFSSIKGTWAISDAGCSGESHLRITSDTIDWGGNIMQGVQHFQLEGPRKIVISGTLFGPDIESLDDSQTFELLPGPPKRLKNKNRIYRLCFSED